jgi:hypothetical protein
MDERCGGCGARFREQSRAQRELWNATFEGGVIVALTCGECQTPAESAEATIHHATLEYERRGGRWVGRPKVGTG